MKKKLLHWLLVMAWMGVIFLFSHQPDLKSSLETVWDTVFRKIAHISEFFVLVYLVWLALREYGLTALKNAALAGSLALGYAILDEWHQAFVRGRHGSPIDVLIDGIGIVIGLGLLYYYKIRKPPQL